MYLLVGLLFPPPCYPLVAILLPGIFEMFKQKLKDSNQKKRRFFLRKSALLHLILYFIHIDTHIYSIMTIKILFIENTFEIR